MKLDKLKGHVPDTVIAQIPGVMEKFEINTPLRLAHFLAQCGHESGNFRLVKENLNYSAKGLMGIFKKYFPNEALAKQHSPLVEGTLLKVFSAATVEQLTTVEGKAKLRKDAADEVTKALQELTGKPVVEQILFIGFVMQ
jgi:hypothetical protein